MDVGEISEAEAGIGLQEDRRLRELQRKKEYVAKQQRWLVFLRHCAKCQAAEGQCTYGQSCTVAKQLWSHMLTCADPNCKYPRCLTSRELLEHHQHCTSNCCPVCTPVKQFVQMQRLAMQKQPQQEKKQHASEAQHKKEYVAKQQRWLLFLRHCAKCQAAEGQCTYGQSCTIAKQLWRHMLTCTDPNCKYPRCLTSRELLEHHQHCTSNCCPVCTPVKQFVQMQRLARQKQQQQEEQQHMQQQQQHHAAAAA